jgi:type VI secretion system protein ImpJ
MAFWTEIHWSEGMFLRPHHLQGAQRYLETVVGAGLLAARPYAWGFLDVQIAKEPLENFTLRIDRCDLRLKDGTWVCVPDNTEVGPLDFKDALAAGQGQVEIFLGVPEMQEVRPNSLSLENPGSLDGTPRYEPRPLVRRDENTGGNPQTLYIRRMRGRLFTQRDDMVGYEVVRLCRLRRTDRPGAVPEFDPLGAGPLLKLQADTGLAGIITSLADQVEAKDEVLANEAREHRMLFTDGVAANTEHLLKLHVLNESRAHLRALLQCPVLHPYDVFIVMARLAGHLSIFGEDLVPAALPVYDQDRPGEALDDLRRRIEMLLDAIRSFKFAMRPFARKKDMLSREGLEVELDRKWVDENLELFVGLTAEQMDIEEVKREIYTKLDMKLASPSRSPRIHNIAVRGLTLQSKAPPAGTLPRRQGLHYFKVDKTIGPDRTDYWKECEQERGIRMSLKEGQMAAMEKFQPTLYVVLK